MVARSPLTLVYAPPAASSPPRAKALFLLNTRSPLNETPFLAALDRHGVSVGRLSMVLGVSRTTASRLTQGKPPSAEQEALVLRRWGK